MKSSPSLNDSPEFKNLGCVIMASGLGRRFGGNKLMAGFAGKPMIAWILDATQGLFGRRIVVTRHADVARCCEDCGADVLLHALPHRSDTVRLGLEAIGQEPDGCMFCPGDQPLLRRESLRALAASAAARPEAIWQLKGEGGPGTPVLFPRWCFDELLNLPQGRGGNALLKKYPERICFVSARDEIEMMDVDSPEDMAAILRHIGGLYELPHG